MPLLKSEHPKLINFIHCISNSQAITTTQTIHKATPSTGKDTTLATKHRTGNFPVADSNFYNIQENYP